MAELPLAVAVAVGSVVVAAVPATALLAEALAVASEVVVLAGWPFCACRAAIRVCIKADMACAGFCVEDVLLVDVLPEDALVAAALVAEALPDKPITSPTPSAESA